MKTLRLISLATLLTGAITLMPSTAIASTNVTAGGRQYLSDVAPLNAAVSKWIAETMKWTNSTTNAQIKAQDAPFNAALHTFQKRLLDQLWPRIAARKIASLYTSVSSLEGTVSSLDTLSMPLARAFLSEAQGEDVITASNANPVRRSLGLPPLANPSARKLNYKF